MYFQKFPQTLYSLDDRKTAQVVTNILLRVKISEVLANDFGVYDLYDIQDGETPEILAFKIYGDSNLHWIILHANEILDPRFEWLLSTNNLYEFVTGKYDKVNGVHHYEDANGNTITGNLSLTVNSTTGFSVGSPITSNVDTNIGYITSIPNSTTMVIEATKGGFQSGDRVLLYSNTNISANITSTVVNVGTAVTNLGYEEELNETRRRIKIIKPQFIEKVISDFESKIAL